MQLEFIVDGQTLKRNPTDKQAPVANSRGYLKAHFALTAEFKGLVSAYFKIYQDGIPQGEPMPLDDNFTCSVPDAVIKSGILYVSLSCIDDGLYIPTNDVLIPIEASGIPTEIIQEPDGTLNEYEDFQRMYSEIMSLGGGVDGDDGKSIEYFWDGTSLGIRQEGEDTFQFVDLKGEKGDKGNTGDKGDNGITPTKGIDYFTSTEIETIRLDIEAEIASITTVVPESNVYTIDFQNKPSINRAIATSDTIAKTIHVINVPVRTELYLELTYNNAAAITWFSGIAWLGGSPPVLSTGETYRIGFFTSNGGTAWHGFCVGGWPND